MQTPGRLSVEGKRNQTGQLKEHPVLALSGHDRMTAAPMRQRNGKVLCLSPRKDEGMVMRLVANGARIKELRTGGTAELPQKTLAARCGISERQLRRMENKNAVTKLPVLERVAKELGVGVGDISYGIGGPQLVLSEKKPAPETPEIMHLPRHTTASLPPVVSAQSLYELAKSSMKVVPHVLADAGQAEMEMIEEFLEILKVISDQEWSYGRPVASDAHDGNDFPEVSRRRRLAELFVLLKGHDIRILAETAICDYPTGKKHWLEAWHSQEHLLVAFAPPRGEYEEERVTVPFDRGRELVLPYKPIGPDTPRCAACGSYFFESQVDEPGAPIKSRCRSCGWIKDDTERTPSKIEFGA
jgi:transcriptional regulator with XRE-family HTH domain